jgi:hypothetical protein
MPTIKRFTRKDPDIWLLKRPTDTATERLGAQHDDTFFGRSTISFASKHYLDIDLCTDRLFLT